jgi:hypothetical protein
LPAGADRIGQPAHDRERRALSRERERERRRPSRRERSRERDLSLRANRRASLKHADGNNQRKEQPKTNHQPATLAARRSDVVDPTSGAQQRHARRVPIRTSRAPTHSPSGACVQQDERKGGRTEHRAAACGHARGYSCGCGACTRPGCKSQGVCAGWRLYTARCLARALRAAPPQQRSCSAQQRNGRRLYFSHVSPAVAACA